MLVLFGLLAYLDSRMRASGGAGLLSLEFAGTGSRASAILAEWGPGAERAAVWAQVVDYGFIVAYAAFLVIAVRAAKGRAQRFGSRPLERAARPIAVGVVVAAVSDAIQNAALLVVLDHRSLGAAAWVARACGIVTTTLLVISIGYLGAVRRRGRRLGAPT